MEVWIDLVDFEDSYQISNNGNVRNKKTKRILKFQTTGKSKKYKRVSLYNPKTNKNMRYSIHRLVALSFIPNPLNKSQINHINGIQSDNRIDNLEWVTGKENMKHYNTKKDIV